MRSPFFLLFNPTLLRAMLPDDGIGESASLSSRRDLVTYPRRTAGLRRQKTEENQMWPKKATL